MTLTIESYDIHTQFWIATMASMSWLAIGAFLREFFRDWQIRMAGRMICGAAIAVICGFSYHATQECERQVANGDEHRRTDGEERFTASEIADSGREVQVPKTISITTPGGNIIRFTNAAGNSRLSRTADRSGCRDSRQTECRCGRGGNRNATSKQTGDSDGGGDRIAGAAAGFTKLPDASVIDLGKDL